MQHLGHAEGSHAAFGSRRGTARRTAKYSTKTNPVKNLYKNQWFLGIFARAGAGPVPKPHGNAIAGGGNVTMKLCLTDTVGTPCCVWECVVPVAQGKRCGRSNATTRGRALCVFERLNVVETPRAGPTEGVAASPPRHTHTRKGLGTIQQTRSTKAIGIGQSYVTKLIKMGLSTRGPDASTDHLNDQCCRRSTVQQSGYGV